MDNAGSTAFEVIARLPLTLPVDSGAKMMLKVAFAPGIQRKRSRKPAQAESRSAHHGLRNRYARRGIVGQRNGLAALAAHRHVTEALAALVEHQLTIAHSGSGKGHSRCTAGATTRNGSRGTKRSRRVRSKNYTDCGILTSRHHRGKAG